MTVTTPPAAHFTTGNPLSAGTNRPFTTDNLLSTTAYRPSTAARQALHGTDRTGWFGAMTKKNAI